MTEPAVASTRSAVGLRSERGPVLLAIMVSTALVALEATVLATAVPTIVADLGSPEQYPWLFSVYLLAQAVSVPVYSKLADTIGRKPIILVGIGLFLVGSIASGFAWSMGALIAFRALQGLGAGAVQPISMTIIGDIYTLEERARTQGYVAGVWAAGSVIGPLVGGLFSEFVSWRWIFFVNIPLCLFAAWLIVRHLKESVERKRHRIDYAGALVLTAALSLVLLGVLEGGVAWAWDSPASIGVFVAGAVLLALFVAIERRAAEPIIDLGVLGRRLVWTTSLLSVAIGAVMIGISSFVPTYLEGSLGVTALVSGFTTAALTLGWPVSATLSGRVYLRLGFRATVLIGASVAALAGVGFALVGPHPSVWGTAAVLFAIGLGMGLTAAPSLIAAQTSVDWNQRGAVTGMNMFARSFGSALGAAIFGAVANGILHAPGADAADPGVVIHAGTAVFIGVAVSTLLLVVLGALMPKDRAALR